MLGGAAPVIGEWTFVAMRHTQGGALSLFVGDQTFVSAGAVTYGSGVNALTLGRNATFSEFFDGRADNIFVYDEALSDARVAEIRTGGAAAITGAAVPEPGTAALAGTGALGLLAFGACRKRS